jgi:membrane-associated phospholipid phosphatase
VLLYGAYDATRGLRHSSVVTANHNGWLLLHAERHLHGTPEHPLNQLLWHLPGLAVPSAYFYATLHFIVTPGVLVWLYRRHANSYRTARRVLVIATVASLVGFWLFPTAPPRLLPGSGIRDTLADVHQWGWWAGPSSAPRGLGGLANEYAAMPSLHVAWALWAGWLVTRHAHHHLIRIGGASYPVLTAFVVMATGNHYFLDVLAGAAVLALAAVAVMPLPHRSASRSGRRARRSRRIDPRARATLAAAVVLPAAWIFRTSDGRRP